MNSLLVSLMLVLAASGCSEEKEKAPDTPPVRDETVKDIKLIDRGIVGQVTGNTRTLLSIVEPLANAGYTSPNDTDTRWNVGGTDLGIIWEIKEGTYGLLFGDTYGADFKPVLGGGPGAASDWRSNVLAFSTDENLEDGLTFDSMLADPDNPSRAKHIIPRENDGYFTPIPTAAIALNGKQYLHYMYWQVGTNWHEKNYSSIYCSEDDGQTWVSCRDKIVFDNESNFGMVGYAVKGDYCYMIGTHIGRSGPAYLARFKHDDILNKDEYEFWEGYRKEWIKGDEKSATILLDGTVGELSFTWIEDLGKWLVIYFDEAAYALCYRSADEITGPWSSEKVLAKGATYPQLYGSYIHPIVKDNTLYYTMSMWLPYNVFLMKATVVL